MIGYVTIGTDNIEKSGHFYDKLLAELGATNEGDPGPRGAGNFYGGYFRDLDGNKLVFFNM